MLRLPVHPHIRGVYFSPQLMGPTYYGPSPHTWGLLQPGDCSSSPKRSIPTYVGFTSGSGPVPRGGPVHPHIRGVYRIAAHVAGDKAGPSPHTWGLQSAPAFPGDFPAVHPHIRGVYQSPDSAMFMVGGPSPHTWGLRMAARGAAVLSWSIPTYVGFTLK